MHLWWGLACEGMPSCPTVPCACCMCPCQDGVPAAAQGLSILPSHSHATLKHCCCHRCRRKPVPYVPPWFQTMMCRCFGCLVAVLGPWLAEAVMHFVTCSHHAAVVSVLCAMSLGCCVGGSGASQQWTRCGRWCSLSNGQFFVKARCRGLLWVLWSLARHSGGQRCRARVGSTLPLGVYAHPHPFRTMPYRRVCMLWVTHVWDACGPCAKGHFVSVCGAENVVLVLPCLVDEDLCFVSSCFSRSVPLCVSCVSLQAEAVAALEAREEALQAEARRLEDLRRRLDAERMELAAQREKLQEMALRIKEDAALLAAKSRAIQGGCLTPALKPSLSSLPYFSSPLFPFPFPFPALHVQCLWLT